MSEEEDTLDFEPETRTLGQWIDSMGITASAVESGDYFIGGAVVILHLVDRHSDVPDLAVLWNDGLSWITRNGMITLAGKVDEMVGPGLPDEIEDEEDD